MPARIFLWKQNQNHYALKLDKSPYSIQRSYMLPLVPYQKHYPELQVFIQPVECYGYELVSGVPLSQQSCMSPMSHYVTSAVCTPWWWCGFLVYTALTVHCLSSPLETQRAHVCDLLSNKSCGLSLHIDGSDQYFSCARVRTVERDGED